MIQDDRVLVEVAFADVDEPLAKDSSTLGGMPGSRQRTKVANTANPNMGVATRSSTSVAGLRDGRCARKLK